MSFCCDPIMTSNVKHKQTQSGSCIHQHTHSLTPTHIPCRRHQRREWWSDVICPLTQCGSYATTTAGCPSNKDNTLKERTWQKRALLDTSLSGVEMKTYTNLADKWQECWPITAHLICQSAHSKAELNQSAAKQSLHVSHHSPLKKKKKGGGL